MRNARRHSQADLAEALDTDQGNVSRLEQQADMYVSTLRRYLEALGGTLEIVAHFPDRDVRITKRDTRRVRWAAIIFFRLQSPVAIAFIS